MRRCAWVALWVAHATAAAAQSAPPEIEPNPEAEKLFRDGRKLLLDGNVEQACDAFAASSKLGPSVGPAPGSDPYADR